MYSKFVFRNYTMCGDVRYYFERAWLAAVEHPFDALYWLSGIYTGKVQPFMGWGWSGVGLIIL